MKDGVMKGSAASGALEGVRKRGVEPPVREEVREGDGKLSGGKSEGGKDRELVSAEQTKCLFLKQNKQTNNYLSIIPYK